MTMNTDSHPIHAERAGRRIGRLWRGLLMQRIRITNWLTNKGIAPWIAGIALGIAGLAIVVALLIVAFWLAVLIVCAVVVVRLADGASQPEETDPGEWRHGLQGFGLYNQTGIRIDPHDPTR